MTQRLRLSERSERTSAWGGAPAESFTEQSDLVIKIRSVSDGGAWGWGPTRIK